MHVSLSHDPAFTAAAIMLSTIGVTNNTHTCHAFCHAISSDVSSTAISGPSGL